MKKIAIAVFALLLSAGFQLASANTQQTNMSVDEKLQKLDKELNLSADQEAQIRPLLEQKNAGTLSKEDCKQQVRAILTEEQRVKFDAMKAEKSSTTNPTIPESQQSEPASGPAKTY